MGKKQLEEVLVKDIRDNPVRYGREFVYNLVHPIELGILPIKKDSWFKKLLRKFKGQKFSG